MQRVVAAKQNYPDLGARLGDVYGLLERIGREARTKQEQPQKQKKAA